MSENDYYEIQQLMARYAFAIDAKDYGGIEECFATDATAIYAGHSRTLRGHAEIVAHMKRALDLAEVTQHLFTNFIIDVDNDRGQLKCDVLGRHVRGDERLSAGGKYEVELRRSSGKWKITRVSARAVWSEGNTEMLPKAG